MKLLNKISIWFIGIVLLITPITMYISRTNIRKSIEEAEIARLQRVNQQVAGRLIKGEQPGSATGERAVEISVFEGQVPAKLPEVKYFCDDTVPGLQKNECLVRVSSYVSAEGKIYKISSSNYVTKTGYLLEGMMGALAWKLSLIVAGIFITAGLLSRHIFKPFKQAMEAIRHFRLQQKQNFRLAPTTTTEFRELNEFLQKMIDKVVEDYTAVKEFSENASHELQTPLAVIQTKLDLLAETDIDGTQSALIVDMQHAIQKLNRINRSLTLLTRLENHEFTNENHIKFCRITKDVIAAFADRISLKGITVNEQLGSHVLVKIHPTLAEILVSNLLMNAIRHNVEGGEIRMELTQKHFCIGNTGRPPEIPTEELFQRFKKGNQSADSIGLGLAIVKQICEVSQLSVFYQYQDGWHRVTVCFYPTTSPVEEMAVQPVNTPVLANT